MSQKPQVAELLMAASNLIHNVDDDLKPWDYGWCSEGYRRSPDARLTAPTGTARMETKGVEYFEAAVESLLNDQEIQKRWDPKEFWGIIASLVVHLRASGATLTVAEQQVARLRNARPSLVLMPVANVVWNGPPLIVGGAAIGDWDDADFARTVTRLHVETAKSVLSEYIAGQRHRRPMVGFATTVPSQQDRAFEDAARHFEQLCDTALLLDRDKQGHQLYSMRGGWNRPGVRGLMLDRGTATEVFRATSDSMELRNQPLVLGELGTSSVVRWYGANPLPLRMLLEDSSIHAATKTVLGEKAGVATRIQVAARWFAEAFYSIKPDDAALALGVALDSLIGSRSGLPGRVMRDRYALLDPNPETRVGRAARYDEIFSVRSAVAHGGVSKRLTEDGFIRGVETDVTWAAWRLLAVEEEFGHDLAGDLDLLYDQLRWGVLRWA